MKGKTALSLNFFFRNVKGLVFRSCILTLYLHCHSSWLGSLRFLHSPTSPIPLYNHRSGYRVGIENRYGLDGPGIESWRERDFSHPPDRPWGRPRLLYSGNRVIPGSKTPGPWVWPAAPSSDEVKERVELTSYPSGPSWPVLGWNLPLFTLYITAQITDSFHLCF
jgi:hypothetical protein